MQGVKGEEGGGRGLEHGVLAITHASMHQLAPCIGIWLPINPPVDVDWRIGHADRDNIHTFQMQILSAPLLLYSCCNCSARFIKHLSNKNSFDGIWLLTFIIYKFVADTSFIILRCQKVTSDNEEVGSDYVSTIEISSDFVDHVISQ